MSPLPSVSSKINFAEEKLGDVWADLWVVGAGTLGSLVAEQWKAQFPDSRVVAETRSATRHEGFAAKGIEPRLRHERKDDERTTRCARHVLVCFPPSSFVGSQDLFEELAEACRLWAGPLGGGKLVYTSSTAVYGDSHGNTVTERFRVDTRTSRSTRMLNAEEQIVTRGGDIVRLAGLYNVERGPHTFWLKAGAVDGSEDGRLNLLHYEDAAAACILALRTAVKGSNIDANMYSNSNKDTLQLSNQNIFLVSDDAPATRVAVCAAALASKQFPGKQMPTFTAKEGPPGKLCDSSWTREKLGWRPTHRSFNAFMRRLGGEEVADEPVGAAAAGAGAAPARASGLWLPGDEDDLL